MDKKIKTQISKTVSRYSMEEALAAIEKEKVEFAKGNYDGVIAHEAECAERLIKKLEAQAQASATRADAIDATADDSILQSRIESGDVEGLIGAHLKNLAKICRELKKQDRKFKAWIMRGVVGVNLYTPKGWGEGGYEGKPKTWHKFRFEKNDGCARAVCRWCEKDDGWKSVEVKI